MSKSIVLSLTLGLLLTSRPGRAQDLTYSQFMAEQQKDWVSKDTLHGRGYAPRSFEVGYSRNWCKRGLDCRDKIVMVHSETGTCSGVLVAKRVILTNRHCVEDIVQKPNGAFHKFILILTPQTDSTRKDFKLAFATNLIAISPTTYESDGVKPDYAFLLLNQDLEGVTPAKLSFEGVRGGETYSIYGASPFVPVSDPQAIERRECKAIYNSTFGPNFDSPKDATIKFADCPIGPSNSGAPIYNSRDELVGIIGGQFSPTDVEILNSIGHHLFKSVDDGTALSHIGWGANLACMPDIRDLAKPIPPECDEDFARPKAFADIPETLVGRVRADLKEESDHDSKFGYAIERANEADSVLKLLSQSAYIRVPKCISRAEAGQGMREKLLKTLPMDLDFSAFKLSRYWEILPDTTGPRKLNTRIQFSPALLAKKGFSEMVVFVGDGLPIHRGTIRLCP